MNGPVGPFFVAPHQDGSEGVDYLGLRAINLNMMNTLLPGINNVVSLVRPFSLMSWVCWRYEQAVRQSGAEARSSDFRRFREKIETLFVWSHVQIQDAAGLPGNQQKDSNAETLAFQFTPFKRTVSFLDAVQYGPALKTQNGLGFLFAADGFFKVTKAGEALAKGLDASLRSNLTAQQYQFLSSIDAVRAERDALDGIVSGWSADNAEASERAAFSEELYQPGKIGKGDPAGVRSTMLHFVMETLRERGPMTTVEMRWHMTCSELAPSLKAHPGAAIFPYAQSAWRLLQTRQAQRLGLEGLFGWVERCLVHENARSVDELVELTIEAMRRDGQAITIDDEFVRNGYEFYRRKNASLDELFGTDPTSEPLADLFSNMEYLERVATDRTTKSPLALASIALLLQCAALVDAFRSDPHEPGLLDDGPTVRIPLGHWGKVVVNHLRLPLRDFLRKVIETFLISQHLGVAAARSRDERSRMRISIEDSGLMSLLPGGSKVLVPGRTADRLATAMALMANCGLIEASSTLRNANGDVNYWV